MKTSPHEIEVKFRSRTIELLTRAGLKLEIETARHFEDNLLLDTPERHLSSNEAILRVRSAGGKGSITYKENASPSAPASQFKQRLEIETAIDDPQSALEVFERLGYRQWFRYQKYRTVYRATLTNGRTLHVMFDETPLGNFIELEGEEEAIADAVKLLPLTPVDYILESYLEIQAEECQKRGKGLEDMVFRPGR